jgi:hypothetical protein
LVQAGKTSGPGLTATIVTDVTQDGDFKGQTAIRVQKASASQAVIFESGYVASVGFIPGSCVSTGFFDLVTSTAARFAGWYIDGIIDDPAALQALLGNFGDPAKAAITSVDYVSCTPVTDLAGNTRQFLSFSAVIGFSK